MEMLANILLLVLFVTFTCISVVLFKIGYNSLGFKPELTFIFKWVFHPYIFISLTLAFFSRFIYYTLQGSFGAIGTFLITTISIPVTILVSWLILGESLNNLQIIGAVLVIIGVGLLGGGV